MSPAPSCTTADDEAIPPALGAVSKTTETKTEDAPQPVGLRLGGLQIDRAQMERDRIARQAARMGTSVKPEVSKPVESRNAVASSSKGASSSNAASSYRAIPSSSKPSSSNGAGRTLPPPLPRLKDHPIQSAGPFPRDAAGEYYVDGELRHVSLRIGRDSTAKIFSPRDVFGKVSCLTPH
jgi:tyrosyl-DNA phosphodiesterase-1